MGFNDGPLFVALGGAPPRPAAATSSAPDAGGRAAVASSSCHHRQTANLSVAVSTAGTTSVTSSGTRVLSHRRFLYSSGNAARTASASIVSVGGAAPSATVRACGGGMAVEAIPQKNGAVMLVVKPCLRCLAHGRLDCQCEHLDTEFAGERRLGSAAGARHFFRRTLSSSTSFIGGGNGRISFGFGGGSSGNIICAIIVPKVLSSARKMFSWLWYDERTKDGISRIKLGGVLGALAAASFLVQLPVKSFVILALVVFCAILYRSFPDEATIVSTVVVRRPVEQVMRHLTHPRPYRSPALPAVLAGAKAGLLPECSSLPQYISQRALAAVTSASASLHSAPSSSSSANGHGASNGSGGAAAAPAAASGTHFPAVPLPISVPSTSGSAEAAAPVSSVASMPRAASPSPTNLDAVLAGAAQAPSQPGVELGEELRAEGVVRQALWRVTAMQPTHLGMELVDRDGLAGWLRGDGSTAFDLEEQADGTTLVKRTTVVRQGYKLARFVEKATWRRFLHLAHDASLEELRANVEASPRSATARGPD